jgi:hypothetical protein
MIFSTIFSARTCAFGRGAGGEDLLGLLVVLDEGGGERLGELGAVAVERVGLDAERPGQLVGLLAILDRRVLRHVDGLGDRARDEGLGGGHHGDVRGDREVALALLAAGVGAVEDRVVLLLQVRRAFEGHGAADVVVGGLDLGLVKPRWRRRSKVGSFSFSRDAEGGGAELLAQGPLVEDEADVEGRGKRGLDLLDLRRAEALRRGARCG